MKSCDTIHAFEIDNSCITSISELYELLRSMSDVKYRQYVNQEKNDFSKWISDVFHNKALAEQILSSKTRLEAISAIENHLEIVIIGGNSGGLAVAARLRRLSEKVKIKIIEKSQYISWGNCGMPYYIGGKITDRERLILNTPENLANDFNLEIETGNEVIEINKVEKAITCVYKGMNCRFFYDYLVIASGSVPIIPNIKGIDDEKVFFLKNMEDMDRIKDRAKKIKSAVILGGGLISLELAENLAELGIDTNIVEAKTHVVSAILDFEMAQRLHKELKCNGVGIYLNDSVKEIISGNMLELKLASGKTLATDMLICAIGVVPNTSFLHESGIDTNERGSIKVDHGLRTSDKSIYAVGDSILVHHKIYGKEMMIPLAGLARKQARIAADNILGGDRKTKSVIGTSIFKAFGIDIASTGVTESYLKTTGKKYRKLYVFPLDHAEYYPNANKLSIKVLFEDNGKILGSQVIGSSAVDKTINAISFAIAKDISIFELDDIEFAYAPPYDNAKNPVNYIANLAENIVNGKMKLVDCQEVSKSGMIILDVRTKEEYICGHIDNSINIPISEIRKRLKDIPSNKPLLIYCAVGKRGYFVSRILEQNGYECYNLNGGYEIFKLIFDKDDFTKSLSRSKNDNSCKETYLDTCGLCCPGPILKLQKHIDNMKDGETIDIIASDISFTNDLPNWANKTGNKVMKIISKSGKIFAKVQKGKVEEKPVIEKNEKLSFMIASKDLKRVEISLMYAQIAQSVGSDIVLFFTSDALKIIMKQKTKDKRMISVLSTITMLKEGGAKIVACSKAMSELKKKQKDLINGVDIEGLMSFYGNGGKSYII